jgi:hypothetical protein
MFRMIKLFFASIEREKILQKREEEKRIEERRIKMIDRAIDSVLTMWVPVDFSSISLYTRETDDIQEYETIIKALIRFKARSHELKEKQSPKMDFSFGKEFKGGANTIRVEKPKENIVLTPKSEIKRKSNNG